MKADSSELPSENTQGAQPPKSGVFGKAGAGTLQPLQDAQRLKPSIAESDLDSTGFSHTLTLINGKYKMTILYCLAQFGCVRFNEMQRYIATISFKTLSANLKALEADGLVVRKEYPQIPPKVEYRLSEKGESLIPIIEAMCYWGEAHCE